MKAANAIITKRRNGLNSRATTRPDNHAQFSVARFNDPISSGLCDDELVPPRLALLISGPTALAGRTDVSQPSPKARPIRRAAVCVFVERARGVLSVSFQVSFR